MCLHYQFTTCIDDVPPPHRELQQTIMSVNTIQEEKESLFKATEELQTTLEVSFNFCTHNDRCAYTHIWASYHIHIGSFFACVCVAGCFISPPFPSSTQVISKEKEKTTAELQEREKLARELEEEKQQLEEATSHLKAGIIVSKQPIFLPCLC